MQTKEGYDPRFPIGPFTKPTELSPEERESAILTLSELPEQLREAVEGLSEEQLDTPYREGGWTVRQVVHHLADSHTTAFHRFRKALTEDTPTVTGYPESLFAELPDRPSPAEWSLQILEGIHARWVMMLQHLKDEQWERGFVHAERGPQTLCEALFLYAWHCEHHLAHITHLRAQRRW